MRLLDGGSGRRQPKRDAVEPRHGFLRHRTAQFAERHVAGRIGAEEVHEPRLVGRIAFRLRLAHREHHVAMGVVDGEHAVGAGDADLERIDGARPRHRQRPGDVEMIDAAVRHHDHARGGVDALVKRAKNLVDRARIAFDRRLLLQVPHAHVERVRAGNHHRRDRGRIVGALVVVDRDEAVHERARGDERDVAEGTRAHLFLAGQPFAAKALGVTDDGVDLGVLDRLQHLRRLLQVRRERLFDQDWNAARDGRHDRLDVKMLVGRDDRAGRFGAIDQLDVALRDKIGADFAGYFARAVRILLGKADPLHRRMAVRDFAAEQADAAAADDGEADVFRFSSHVSIVSAVIPGRAVRREPGIQIRTPNALLDSGFARFASAPE